MGRSFLARSFALLTVLSGIPNVTFASSNEALWPLQTYKSSPIKTPYLNVTKMGQTEPGYLFFTPQDIIRDKGYPTIYSDDGQLVWQGAEGNYSALQPQMLNGEPVIAYWKGYDGQGFGFGHISILNSSYDEIHRVTLDCKSENFVTVFEDMEFESCIDIHESQFTSNGTILVTAVNVTQADLSSVGGPKDGWIQDGLIYEIDLETNEILFRWSAHEHIDQVPLSDVRAPLEGSESGVNRTSPYGYPHLNAVYKYGNNYLLSSRYMCSIFFIDSSGDITWHLHGRTGGDFKLGLGTSFCYQHDARFESQSNERVTLALHNNDNADFSAHTSLTTGLLLDVELQGSKQVTLKRRTWDADEPVYAESQGSYQSLANGHVLQDHGATPKIEEYDENGTIVMRARFGYDNTMQTYRAYRYPWTGHPSTKPSVAACLSHETNKTNVYVSWNGATDVKSWKISSGGEVKKTSMRNGFETTIQVGGLTSGEELTVEAIGGVGDGTMSEPFKVNQIC